MSTDDADFAGQLRVLASMGFSDREQCLRALHKSGGRINQAVDLIVAGQVDAPDDEQISQSQRRQQQTPYQQTSSHELYASQPVASLDRTRQDMLRKLLEMGFTDQHRNRHALERTRWTSLDQAVALLIDNQDGNIPAPAATPKVTQAMNVRPMQGAVSTIVQIPQPQPNTAGSSMFTSIPSNPFEPEAMQQQQFHHQKLQKPAHQPSAAIATSRRYNPSQKSVLAEFDPFSDDNRI